MVRGYKDLATSQDVGMRAMRIGVGQTIGRQTQDDDAKDDLDSSDGVDPRKAQSHDDRNGCSPAFSHGERCV